MPRHPGPSRSVLLAFVAALGIALPGALLGGCEAGDSAGKAAGAPAETASTAAPDRPSEQFFDYRLIESEAGVKQWILESKEMQKFSGQRDIILIDVHMDFFQEGEHFSVLVADSGRANIQTSAVFTWGNVVVTTDDGRQLETEELYFDDATGLIHNDVFNRFTRQADVMTGMGLEATPDLEYIEIKRDVKAAVTDTSGLVGPADDPTGPEGEQH